MTHYQLFVYGSLRKDFGHPAHQFISKYFDFVGPARIKGGIYDLGEYPAAVPASGEEYIIGELYSILKTDEFSYAIAQLDDYEGLFPEQGEEALYRREMTEIFKQDDNTTQAWVYWYNGSVAGAVKVESGDILEYVKTRK